MAAGLGIAGIFLPILPTTPFLLLAAACYMRGSEKFYNWLMNHPKHGEFIKNYREKKGIKKRVKIQAVILLWIFIEISVVFSRILYG